MNVDYPLIRVAPPGPKARRAVARDSSYLMQSFSRWYPLVAKRAEGFLVEDVDGNVYIDFNSGIAVANVGHRHPAVVEAAKRQLDKFLHYSVADFLYEEVLDLAERLFRITPGGHEKRVFYTNSGAEAIETSIKVARGYFGGRRPYILAFTGSFHGRTLGALSLTSSKPVQRRGFAPLLPAVVHAPYPYCYRCPYRLEYPGCGLWCVDFIEEWILGKYVPPEEVAAVVFEPIAGEGGYVVPPPGFFGKLKELADGHGMLLVDDEIQSGMGRTGRWFAIEHWGVVPDIVALAKALAGGLPLGATVGRAEIMSLPRGSHASTFGGNPVSCAAACATIDAMEREGLVERARDLGERALKRAREMMEEIDYVGDVRGKGLMIGIELVKDRRTKEPHPELLRETIRNSFRNGLLVIGAGTSVIRISPPLVITPEALDRGLAILEQSLRRAVRDLS